MTEPELGILSEDLDESDEGDWEEEEEEWEDEEIIRAKWIMDGAVTLSQAAEQVRAFADSLERMEKDGWQLTRPVDDDYGFLRRGE